MNQGLVDCKIKRYKFKHCGNDCSAYISSIVKPNFTVSNGVMDIVETYYSIDFTNVRKIREFFEFVKHSR